MECTATLNGAKDGMVCWLVTINGQTFSYGEGIGHFVTGGKMWKHPEEVADAIAKYIASKGKVNIRNIQDTLSDFYKPTSRLRIASFGFILKNVEPPKLDDVLYCLVSDAEAENMGFADWCDNFGYDTDSRSALATYLECQETASKLRKARVNIEAERERLAGY